ncbi:hypothetical protein RGQ29_025138 [Quercus rubra]|uniref:Calmodulin-binding protein n=1 Tax=Quercus rubra TaxID=3512 RepID=A0AAN7EXL1_QUERU|nr:hypothetical protein RGQ29_025138 [Quercus rubra]
MGDDGFQNYCLVVIVEYANLVIATGNGGFRCQFGRFLGVLEALIYANEEFVGEITIEGFQRYAAVGKQVEHLLRLHRGSRDHFSFKGRKLETVFSFKTPTAEMENDVFGRCVSSKTRDVDDQLAKSDSLSEKNHQSPLLEPKNNRNKAALKLQKVWKLLDFAELKRSYISFFDIGKPEIAVSCWSRARTRAAKVGKGLCKVGNAKKPALQHWLEAIDPGHRYGHNLQFYYVKWLHCESKQPFFYWLNVGEGQEVNHERCPRLKLQQQCIKYFGPAERKAYEVVVQDGKLVYKQSGEDLHTEGGPKDAKWILVLSTSKTLYVGLKNKGTFQHSSFLAGGATLSAGRLVVEDGILKAVWPHSGHYRPTEENFQELMSFLKEHNVDLTNVKKNPGEEVQEEALYKKGSDICLQSNSTEAVLSQDTESMSKNLSAQECTDSRDQDSNAAEHPTPSMPRLSGELYPKMTRLKIPNQHDEFDLCSRASQLFPKIKKH